MFDAKSRYAGVTNYTVTDRKGRLVSVVSVPVPDSEELRGYHVRKEEQRLDHLAEHYLDNPAGFWRICDLNDVMLPEALSEVEEIAIPQKRR
jgi:hypothetical protein